MSAESTILEILSRERNAYVECLSNSLRAKRVENANAVSEVLIEINSEKFERPYGYIRPDILVPGHPEPEIIEVNKDRYFSFKPISAILNDRTSITLSPLYWNAFEIRIFGHPLTWEPFKEWIHYWMDLDDIRSDQGTEFGNLIHGVTSPQKQSEFWEVSIDMGSADIQAASTLFSLFPALKIERAEIGSFSMIESNILK